MRGGQRRRRANINLAAFSLTKTIAIARAIVARKIKAEDHSKPVERAFLAGLQAAKTTDDVRHIEAKSAQIWWQQWEGFRLSFKGAGVPAEWRVFLTRYVGRPQGKLGELAAQFTARGAIHPMQAMLNFATAIVTARLTRAIIAGHEFERRDFLVFVHKITFERTVRLAPPLAKEIVEVAVKAVSVRECVKVVNWLENVIK